MALDDTKKCSLPVQRVAIIILAGWEAVPFFLYIPFFFCIEMMWNVLKYDLKNMKSMYPVGNYCAEIAENLLNVGYPLHRENRENGKRKNPFCPNRGKTSGIWFAQVVNSLILQGKHREFENAI